jgi:cytochrome c2
MRDIAINFRMLGCAIGALTFLVTTACTTAKTENAAATTSAATAAAGSDGLTPFQTEHGIGPVTAPLLLDGTIDKSMAKSGNAVFEQKCSACHKMDERYVGPALGDVFKRRTPTFVMNMALNPQGMMEKHPVTKKLLAEYMTAMPNQNLSHDEARQVVEYLRTQAH